MSDWPKVAEMQYEDGYEAGLRDALQGAVPVEVKTMPMKDGSALLGVAEGAFVRLKPGPYLLVKRTP